jgi:GT2 family glycosyltransferase
MITTKDRSADLRRTCQVIRRMCPAPIEVLITADGCTDDTVEMVKAELPGAKLIVNQVGKGSVASRDRMMREARGDLVLSLDDDSHPEQVDCIARFAPLFDERPKLAVLHFPQRTDEFPETLHQTDFGPGRMTRSFANSGAVLRRATYLQLPGFEPRFFHAYEEPDYGLQCFAAGYEVYYSPVVTIRHFFSKENRNEMRTHQRHARNEFWSALIRCPFPYVAALIAYRVFSQFRYACRRGIDWAVHEPAWWWRSLCGASYCLHRRRPIPWHRYKAWLQLN